MSSDHRSELIKVPIHRAGVRILMFLGGERTQVLLLAFVSLYFAYLLTVRFNLLYGIAAAASLWLLGIGVLRKLAKNDPQMWAVLKRARKYRGFYPARGRFDAPAPRYPDFK